MVPDTQDELSDHPGPPFLTYLSYFKVPGKKTNQMEPKIRQRDVRTSVLAGGRLLLILIPSPTHQLIHF